MIAPGLGTHNATGAARNGQAVRRRPARAFSKILGNANGGTGNGLPHKIIYLGQRVDEFVAA